MSGSQLDSEATVMNRTSPQTVRSPEAGSGDTHINRQRDANAMRVMKDVHSKCCRTRGGQTEDSQDRGPRSSHEGRAAVG